MKSGLRLLLFLSFITGNATGQSTATLSAKSGWVSVKKSIDAAPVIAWRTPLSTQQSAPVGLFRVTVCIQTASPITRIVVVQNDKTIPAGQRGIKRVTCGQEITVDITLLSGLNKLVVEATNATGTTRSEPRLVTGLSEKAPVAILPAVQKRLALVMANAAYDKQPLKNPTNDGQAMQVHLEKLGFEVMYRENLSKQGLETTIEDFLRSLGNNNVGLVYYAGHGLMVDGENYIQPVDANLVRKNNVKWECYPLRRLIEGMQDLNSKGANLVFWDACRINPYRSWQRGPGDPVYAPMQPARGTFIVYATAADKPANDGEDDNHSHFTGELIQHIDKPNVDLYKLVGLIGRGLEARGIRQTPYTEGLLEGEFFFNPEH